MSSSIEPEFNPPESKSIKEVIELARHYINYWRIEAVHNNDQLTRVLIENEDYKTSINRLRDRYGDLVSENSKLKAEVERLTKGHSDALADFWSIHKGYFELKAEVERLKGGKQ